MSDLQLEIREARRAADRLYDRTATPSDLHAVRDTLTRAGEEIERLRKAFETLYIPSEGFGPEFDDMISLGVIVPVPADEEFKADWGDDADTMYVFAWHANRHLAASEEADDD